MFADFWESPRALPPNHVQVIRGNVWFQVIGVNLRHLRVPLFLKYFATWANAVMQNEKFKSVNEIRGDHPQIPQMFADFWKARACCHQIVFKLSGETFGSK
jgi:hypothetical protein